MRWKTSPETSPTRRTAGFKRVDTSFSDLVPDSALNRQISGSVARLQPGDQHDPGRSQRDPHRHQRRDQRRRLLRRRPARRAASAPTRQFANSNLYTRRGDFDFDANGYLVNGAGYFLKGLKIDTVTGQLIGTQPEVLRITKEQFPAKATTSIEYRANIPSLCRPRAKQDDPYRTPGCWIQRLRPAPARVRLADAAPARSIGTDVTTFLRQSIPGGSVTVYDSLGKATPVELRWAKVDNADRCRRLDTWSLFVAKNTGATRRAVAYTRARTRPSLSAQPAR